MTGAIERDQKLLYGVAIALMGSAMLLSGSRGGLVALIVEVLVLIMITTRAKGKKQVLLTASLSFLLLVAAICGAIFVGGDTSFTRFAAATASPDVSSNRMQLWAVTIQVIRDHFPLGAGLGAYGQAFTAYDPSGGALRVDQAHNDYLQMLADAGLVGTVLGVLFLFWFIRDGVRSISVRTTVRRGIAAGAFAGCTGVLVHSLFDFVLHITAISVMFLAVLGMLVAAGRSFTDEEEDPAPQPDNRRKASVSHIKGTFQS
jgi:O-antigen ligase